MSVKPLCGHTGQHEAKLGTSSWSNSADVFHVKPCYEPITTATWRDMMRPFFRKLNPEVDADMQWKLFTGFRQVH